MAIIRMTSKEIDKKYPARKERLAKLRAMRDEDINFTDIPETTDEEFATATRRGRPLKEERKLPVSIRINERVIEKLRASGRGWQTRLSDKISQLVKKGLL